MCWQRMDERHWDRPTEVSFLDRDSSGDGGYLVSDAERDAALAALRRHAAGGVLTVAEFGERSEEALAARTRDQLRLAFRGLPRPVAGAEAFVPRSSRRPRWIPFPLLPLVVIALIATHGWALIPLAWLLFAFFGPWRRYHGRRSRRATL